MENRKNRYVVKAKMLTKSSGFYDQLEDVDFFVDGGKNCTCGTIPGTIFQGPGCCKCVSPGSSQAELANCESQGEL